MIKYVLLLLLLGYLQLQVSAQRQHNAAFRYSINDKNEVRFGLMFEKEYSSSSIRLSVDLQPQKELVLQPYSHYAKNTFEQLSFGVAWSPFRIALPDKPIAAKFFVNASYQNRSYGTAILLENRNVYLGDINFFELALSNQLSYKFKYLDVFFEPSVGIRFTQNSFLNNTRNNRLYAFSIGASYTF